MAAAATSNAPLSAPPTTTVRPRSVIRENQAGPFTIHPTTDQPKTAHTSQLTAGPNVRASSQR
jgi:hypothetical protein